MRKQMHQQKARYIQKNARTQTKKYEQQEISASNIAQGQPKIKEDANNKELDLTFLMPYFKSQFGESLILQKNFLIDILIDNLNKDKNKIDAKFLRPSIIQNSYKIERLIKTLPVQDQRKVHYSTSNT
ncbi:unnamed protein product [Paramecium primaurelia]|uniref:Uncharacterized protein n=1 Tax=Paramecium primaurelia TaxID=5886 RepID=A0A8S1QVT6_PARPR|nr:unnamed protein product [Paramecium primaurelia]